MIARLSGGFVSGADERNRDMIQIIVRGWQSGYTLM
jgi:hypothetical protein